MCCRLAVWDGRRTLVFRGHRQGWVALRTRGGSAAASDGAHLLVSRQRRCCRRIGWHYHRRRLPPSSGGHGSAAFNRHVVGTWRGVVPGRLTVTRTENDEPSLCTSSPTRCAQRHAIPPGRSHSEVLPPFFSSFCVIFSVARTSTPETRDPVNPDHPLLTITAPDRLFAANRGLLCPAYMDGENTVERRTRGRLHLNG